MAEQKRLDSFLIRKEKWGVEVSRVEKKAEELKPYDLPESWKWVRLGDVILRTQYGISKAMNTEKVGTPIIRMGNITYDGQLDLTDLKYVDVDEKTTEKYMLNKGDILFNRTNSRELVGKTAIFNLDGEYLFVSYLIRVVPNRTKVFPEYLWAFLNSKRGKEILFNIARPAVQMANINAKELCNIRMPLPPLEEQKRIVARIDELMTRAEEARRLRRIAAEEAEKIMQAALHKVFSKAEEEGWKKVKIADVKEEVVSGFPCSKSYIDPNGVVHLRPNNIGNNGKLDLSTFLRVKPPQKIDVKRYYLKREDILFNNTNSVELVGRAVIVDDDLPFTFSNHITRIRVKGKIALPEWLVFSINHLWQEGYFRKYCRRWIGQAGFNATMLLSTEIFVPPLEEQKRTIIHLNEIRETAGSLKKLQQGTEEELEKLAPAILDRAYKGEL